MRTKFFKSALKVALLCGHTAQAVACGSVLGAAQQALRALQAIRGAEC